MNCQKTIIIYYEELEVTISRNIVKILLIIFPDIVRRLKLLILKEKIVIKIMDSWKVAIIKIIDFWQIAIIKSIVIWRMVIIKIIAESWKNSQCKRTIIKIIAELCYYIKPQSSDIIHNGLQSRYTKRRIILLLSLVGI